jgi:hypothetical protein
VALRVGDQTNTRRAWTREEVPSMALIESIREPDRKVLANSCIHCATGWVYEPEKETGEDGAAGCWMCPEGQAIAAGRS